MATGHINGHILAIYPDFSPQVNLSVQRVMSEKAAKFRKTDVTRAVKAVEAAGLTVARVEFDRDGKFSVFTSQEAESHPGQPLDEWLARNARLA